MKYDAVIFDLFGTLVPSLCVRRYETAVRKMAACVDADEQSFVSLWMAKERSHKHMLGIFPSLGAGVRDVCDRLGVRPNQQAVAEAETICTEAVRESLVPRDDSITTLEKLKGMGLKLGLMSDCSPEMPGLWPQTPFVNYIDHALFSCAVGFSKPDSRFYDLACERLSVPPERCCYVGDIGDELFGAVEMGMDAALICPPEEESVIMARESTRKWAGARIASLAEVVDYVG